MLPRPPGSPVINYKMNCKPQLFLDCDGVLADFDSLAEEILGRHPHEAEDLLTTPVFWQRLRGHGSFYRDLPLLPQGRILFAAVQHLHPIILTGCPEGNWAEAQKVAWAAEHFPGTKIITCPSKDKRLHMTAPGDILVDDYHKYKHLWEAAGGIFVLYRKADQALTELEALGLEIRRPSLISQP